MLSIIISTKNEEIFLPKLLQSIKKQNFSNCEIIVADADSTDQTKEIAQKYGAKVVKGGLPAKGKNTGAKAAKGDILLFLDADNLLIDCFFSRALDEFKAEQLDIACFFLSPITKNNLIRIFFEIGYNVPAIVTERFYPHGGCAVMIKKDLYDKIKGYNEELRLCEDHDFIQRAAKFGKFRILRKIKVFTSLRRFYQDGWFRTIMVYVVSELYMGFIGPVKTDMFKYKFGHYSKKIKE